jgi:hypothetical protein
MTSEQPATSAVQQATLTITTPYVDSRRVRGTSITARTACPTWCAAVSRATQSVAIQVDPGAMRGVKKRRWWLPVTILAASALVHCTQSDGTALITPSADASDVDVAVPSPESGPDVAPLDAGTSPGACALGTTACGNACVDVQNDNAHCGACEHACPLEQACVRGSCVVACSPGQLQCAGRCTSIDTDNANCGGCGNACASGQVCSHGQCSATCASDLTVCGDHCVDTAHDPTGCGSCGHVCPFAGNALPVCAQGTCGTVCQTHYADCNGDPNDGCEVNTDTSAANCGRCGKGCSYPAANSACTGGQCTFVSCSPNYGNCDNDASNGCETNLFYDTKNCTACGNVCPLGPNVQAATCYGACGINYCTSGFANCDNDAGNGCEVNIANDDAHCGSCYYACPKGTTCRASTCACPDGQSMCGGACVDVTNSPLNCGACGNVCALPNAASTCQSSACALGACAAGWDNCDGNAANGCEIDLATNLANCGTCGNACAAGQTCSSGVCTAAPACAVKTAPRVLVYRALPQNVFSELPAGAAVTVAGDALWLSYSTAKFASYDLILIETESCAAGDFSAAAASAAAWSAAVTGRIVVSGLDTGSWYSGPGVPTAFHRAAFAWLTSGTGTGLYVGSDCGVRQLDFLSTIGSFSSAGTANYTTVVTSPFHPVMLGITGASLGYYSSGKSTIRVPSGFEVLAVQPQSTPLPLVAARDVLCAP